MQAKNPWALVGHYLVREGKVTRDELQKALAAQKVKLREGTPVLLGDLCIKLGFCTKADVEHAIQCRDRAMLVRKPTTLTAMAAFRDSVKKAKAATKGHRDDRVQMHT